MKNDAVDAEVIYDAASRPTMLFIPVKSVQQHALQSPHRIRERLIVQRTSLINHARGLLGEYGIVLVQGSWRFRERAPAAIRAAKLSPLAEDRFADLRDQLREV